MIWRWMSAQIYQFRHHRSPKISTKALLDLCEELYPSLSSVKNLPFTSMISYSFFVPPSLQLSVFFKFRIFWCHYKIHFPPKWRTVFLIFPAIIVSCEYWPSIDGISFFIPCVTCCFDEENEIKAFQSSCQWWELSRQQTSKCLSSQKHQTSEKRLFAKLCRCSLQQCINIIVNCR